MALLLVEQYAVGTDNSFQYEKSIINQMEKPVSKGNIMETGGKDIRGRCGFHCSCCPAFRENVQGDSDRIRVHQTWKKIYGLDIAPETIRCDGCIRPDNENPYRIGGACEIRACVQQKSIPHCGICSVFPCDLMERHLASVGTVIQESHDTLSPEEFQDFIVPYLCREFLEKSRDQ
jgi:hypothetical protein